MKSVTRYAAENNIDLVAMNPLAGGIIPKNPDYFSVLRSESDATVNIAALRFVASQPPIKVTLIGAKNIAEFDEAMSAFTEPDGEKETRSEKGYASITQMKSFCTNCGYCEPCPKNIPIRKIMQSQNMRLFSKYGRRDTDKQILRHLDLQFGYIPETSKNPCVKCKKCETQCTQRLAIIATIADMYGKFADYGYSLEYRKEQIRKIFTGNNYKKIALWPSGGMADLFLKYYREFFGEPSFDVCFINGNKAKCNEEQSIYDPKSLAKLQPDVILVCSHQYADAIIEEIGELGIVTADVVRLFGESELSWL
jgi:ferredoxin